MPSMSYCKFENTEIDLSQCVAAMEAASTLDDLEMSEYEKRSFYNMWHLCRQFLAEHERLIAAELWLQEEGV